jgi:hypothetical protein
MTDNETEAAAQRIEAGDTTFQEEATAILARKRPSRASRAADRASADGKLAAAKKPTAAKKPAAGKPAGTKPGPPEPEQLTGRQQRAIVMAALVKASADLAAGWSDPRVPKPAVKDMLANRLSYCPGGPEIWDSRLGPRPRGASDGRPAVRHGERARQSRAVQAAARSAGAGRA